MERQGVRAAAGLREASLRLRVNAYRVPLTRGRTATTRGFPQPATGNAEIDSRFVCHTRRPEVAEVLDEPGFVAALVGCPDDISVEFTDRSLLLVGQRRPTEQLSLFTRSAVALAAATPSGLFVP